MIDRFLRMSEVVQLTSLSRSTIWRRIRAGEFPDSVPITPGRVGWKASDIAKWQNNPKKWG
ncbi:helix-turn-helix transcriptional regulator [Pseudomonas marincola]|uniref:helix-turn-helix transcriptional regulator n=1 Tax=Pseudomonas marincola TaxID=437900 RepID=UPI0008E51BAB|nr:AlpA family phage regulatory protein [Pseudomonas marincola]SFT49712.1 transcriptional regulator, AlpA family [Pseudomonas marincola]